MSSPKRKKTNIALLVMGAAIVILAVIAFILSKNSPEIQKSEENNTAIKKESEQQEQEKQQENLKSESEEDTSSAEEEEITVKMISLSEEQKHMGDLILVNSNYAYDFTVNGQNSDLVCINDVKSFNYTVKEENTLLSEHIIESLESMIKDCNTAIGTNDTGVTNGYRTLEYQQQTYDEYEQLYGKEYADAYVAIPGYSEHHTGLAIDLGVYYENGGEGSFTGSQNAEWISTNSYRYGFVRRYQENKTEITKILNESWHFRYVGVVHATYMYQHDLCLEEYIELLRNSTSKENPLIVECEGATYQIYYTAENEIEEPKGEYSVSGDNIDGYIITIKEK